MTPTATTPAARGKRSPSDSKRRAPKAAAPGEAGTRSTRASGHRATSVSRGTPTRPARPRRVSGPVSRPARRPGPRNAPRVRQPLGQRVTGFVRSLPDHSLLDRIIRGRAWIPILGVLLAGIVAMQVEVLKLSAGVGRALERSTALQGRNDQLQASVAQLGDDQRIMRLAATQDGMVMPSPTAPIFVSGRAGASVDKALGNVHAPDGTAFSSSVAALEQSTAGGATVSPATSGTGAGTVTSPTAGATQTTVPGAATAAPVPTPASAATQPATAGGTTSSSGAVPSQGPVSTGASSGAVGATTTSGGG
jgi:hypothetical protein